jgi:hypothetical protein
MVVKDKERGRKGEQIREGPKASSRKWKSIAGRTSVCRTALGGPQFEKLCEVCKLHVSETLIGDLASVWHVGRGSCCSYTVAGK